jgi:hypothetical protein
MIFDGSEVFEGDVVYHVIFGQCKVYRVESSFAKVRSLDGGDLTLNESGMAGSTKVWWWHTRETTPPKLNPNQWKSYSALCESALLLIKACADDNGNYARNS